MGARIKNANRQVRFLRRKQRQPPPKPRARKRGFKPRIRLHSNVRAIRTTLGPGFTPQKQRLLSDYYDNRIHSDSSVTVEVFLYTHCHGKSGKPCAKKFTVNLPSEVAAHVQFKTKVLFTSPLYEIYAQVITHVLPSAGYEFFKISEQEPDFFILYHKGEVPTAQYATLASEPVANGRQSCRLPQHPHLDPRTLPLTEDRNCMPFYLVKTLESAWAKDKTLRKTPLTIPLILSTLQRESPEMSFDDAVPFFRKHRLHVRVVDLSNHLLHEYDPASDAKIRHKTLNQLTFLHHNQHVVPLNHNLNSFYRKTESKISTAHFAGFRNNKTEILTETALLAALSDPEIKQIHYRGPNIAEDGTRTLFHWILRQNKEPLLNLSETNEPTSYTLYLPHRVTIVPSEMSLKTSNKIDTALQQPHYKCHYSPSLRRALNDLKRGHLKRSFLPSDGPKIRIDIVRSYTANCKDLDFFPVFHKSDVFQPFDGTLEPYTLYLVANNDPSPERYLIANHKLNLVTGLVLQQCGLVFEIVAQCRPSGKEPNTVRDTLKELYQNPGDPDLKDANHCFGRVSKLSHTKIEARFSESINEAAAFAPNPIRWEHGFLATKKHELAEKVDGFFGIALMIYDLQRLRMLTLYRLLRSHSVTVFGIATDAFFIDRIPDIPLFKGETKTWEDLGKYQVERPKPSPHELAEITERTSSPEIHVMKPLIPTDTIQDRTFTTAELAGAGKSFAQREYAKGKGKVLVAIQSNKQLIDAKAAFPEATVITYSQLVGEIVDDQGNKKNSWTGPYDTSGFQVLILEELMQIAPIDYLNVLGVVANLKLEILGNGDDFQNSTGCLPSNYTSRQQFYAKTLPYVFTHVQILKGSHRLKTEADAVTMLAIKRELQAGVSVPDVITAFKLQTFTDFDFAKGKPTIAYTNLAGSLIPGSGKLKCKHHDKDKILVKGETYDCTAVIVGGKQFVQIGKNQYPRNWFVDSGGQTGHAVQGSTIDQPFVILESDHFYATREWFYTAVTRATQLKDVWIYTGPSTTGKIETLLFKKMASYVKQDKDAGRPIGSDFITVRWMKAQIGKQNQCCARCFCQVKLEFEPKDPEQISFNRRNNDLPHTEANTEITCLSCNHGYRP